MGCHLKPNCIELVLNPFQRAIRQGWTNDTIPKNLVFQMESRQYYITSPVTTVCMGRAASMGAFLLAAGEPGMRFALPNSQIMIHQPSGGFQGQATDIEIHAREVLRLKERLNRMLAENTKRPYEDVVKATERDNFLTPEEAKELGIIDRVLASRREMAQEKRTNRSKPL